MKEKDEVIALIEQYLDSKGVVNNFVGFTYLTEAIYECLKDVEILKKSGGLVRLLAQRHHVKNSTVSRAIQYALAQANIQESLVAFANKARLDVMSLL